MSFIESATRITGTGLLAAFILGIMSACASQGSTGDGTGTAMSAIADTGAQTAPESQNPPRKLICRTIKPTGSRFGERICMYPEQWQKYAGQGRSALEKVQDRALTTNDQGG